MSRPFDEVYDMHSGQWYRAPKRHLGAAAIPYDLSAPEVQDFYSRHQGTMQLTQTFDAQVQQAGGYTGQQDLSNTSLNWLESAIGIAPGTGYAIPTYGISVNDSVYGNVLIYPDASGVLHYAAGLSDQLAQQVNAKPIISPSGNPQSISDWLSLFQSALAAAGQGLAIGAPIALVLGLVAAAFFVSRR